MIVCTFAGHREADLFGLDQRLNDAIESVLRTDTSFEFITGGMGEFDQKAAAAVRRAKQRHPELDIRLILVCPYMSNSINTQKAYYENQYDDILIPFALACVHYKAAIPKRNRWMIDRANVLIAFVNRAYGGAYAAIRYAKRKSDIKIINIAP